MTNQKSLRLALSVSTLAVLATAPAAFAQEDESYLGQVVVTSASSVATTVQDAPAAVTVIGQDVLQASGARDLRDVLRTVPGLNLTQSNGGDAAGVSIRGLSSSRTLMMVDGKRIASRNAMARNYKGDLDAIPLSAIERIEVVRGPMSTLYGSDAMGGVINIITKPVEDTWSGTVSVDTAYGDASTTADSQALSGYISGPLGKDLTLSAWAKAAGEASAEAHQYTAADGTLTTLTPATGADTRSVGARLEWAASDLNVWGLDLSASNETYRGEIGAHDTNEIKKLSYGLTNELELGNGSLSSYLRREETQNAPWEETKWGEAVEFELTTLESRYTTQSQIGGKTVDLTFGGLLQTESIFDRQTNAADRKTGAKQLIEGSANTAALYTEGRVEFSDKLNLTGGLRLDHHELYGNHLTPRLYANYALSDTLMLKAGYAQAFVAPDLRSLSPDYLLSSKGNGCKPYPGPCYITGNPELQPETSENIEIGLNYQGATLSWELTAFYTDVTDMLGARKTGEKDPGTGFDIFERTNIDSGRTAGLEAGFNWGVNDNLSVNTTASYMAISEFYYEFLDAPFPMSTTPKWNLTAGVDYFASDRVKLSGNVSYVGKQAGYVTAEELSASEARAVPPGQNSKGYFLVDVAASIDLTETAKLNLGIDNLFNGQPEDSVSYREDGRLFKMGLSTQF